MSDGKRLASTTPRTPSPEERELAAKDAELVALQTELAQRELDFATVRIEWHAFEQRYLRTVGLKFAELDDLEAQIAEALNRQHPSDETARQQAADARARARESAGVAGVAESRTPAQNARPSEDIKNLYREVARRIHPDLTTDDAERARRTRVMAEANRAYADGGEARLRAILDEWETSPEAVAGAGIGADLVRTIRKTHQVARRLAEIETAIGELGDSDLARLKARHETEHARGRDLLAEMAARLDQQLLLLRRRRDGLHEASS